MTPRASEVLDRHFESQQPAPPHEIMREKALAQAAKFGIPFEIASKAIDAKLKSAETLYWEMIEARKETEGEVGSLRAQIDAHILASKVSEKYGNVDNQLAELGAIAAKDIRDMVTGGSENLTFRPEETTVA
jgi:hypothetical protein